MQRFLVHLHLGQWVCQDVSGGRNVNIWYFTRFSLDHFSAYGPKSWSLSHAYRLSGNLSRRNGDVSVLRMVKGSGAPVVDPTSTNWLKLGKRRCITTHTAAHSLIFWCQAAVRQPVRDSQSGFHTSRAAVVIEGSIVRLEPSVGAVRNFQTCHNCPSGGFQCFLPDCQAKTAILRGIFRHLVLQHTALFEYSVGFKSWIRTWAPTFENISKSYSHVYF